MDVGDLVEWRADGEVRLWLVRKIEDDTNTAILVSEAGQVIAVGLETEVELVSRPITDWLAISLPTKPLRIRSVSRGRRTLVRMRDWVRVNEFQIGGYLYLSPALKLYQNEVLVLETEGGKKTRLKVPSPRRVAARQVKAKPVLKAAPAEEPPPKKAPALFGLLRGDDD